MVHQRRLIHYAALGAAAAFAVALILMLRGRTGELLFEELAEGVWRHPYLWQTKGMKVDVHTFLVRAAKSPPQYVLIDIGYPDKHPEAQLLHALDVAIADGTLALIILTHGHSDHAGAIRGVLSKYKDVQIVFHEAEAEFVLGGRSYNSIPGSPGQTPYFNMQDVITKENALLLEGESGDVANARSVSGKPPKWLPPKGLLSFHLMDGHSPGQVAFLHTPSKILFAGDAFINMDGLDVPPAVFTPNMTQAKLSVQKARGLDYSLAYPTHNAEAAIPKRKVDEWLSKLT